MLEKSNEHFDAPPGFVSTKEIPSDIPFEIDNDDRESGNEEFHPESLAVEFEEDELEEARKTGS